MSYFSKLYSEGTYSRGKIRCVYTQENVAGICYSKSSITLYNYNSVKCIIMQLSRELFFRMVISVFLLFVIRLGLKFCI